MALATAVLALVACAPATGGTRSATELGVRVPRRDVATTLPPAPAPDPLVPVTTQRPPSPDGSSGLPPAGTFVTPGSRLGVAGCELFPRDHAFHADIRRLPVHPRSSQMIQAAGPGLQLGTGFGSGIYQGSRRGYPVNVVDGGTSERRDIIVSLNYQYMSEPLGIPWPTEPRFEGWPGRAWDKHLLVVDSSACRSWELINVQPPWENVFGALLNRWYADASVSIDLNSNQPRAGGTVTASGLSMLATLVRYDEVASGRIDHVLGMGMPLTRRGGSVWPAMGGDGVSDDPNAPPMGSWLRLRADVDLSGLGPQAAVVARALKEHGAVANDTGPGLGMPGEPDLRWNEADLAGLSRLTLSDFEIVDPTPMKVSDSTYRIR